MSDEENRATKNKKSVYSILVDFHPQFLEAIKDVYPLGVLSSLSMTIAAFITAFGKESLILAQTYAIAASLMFLLAFSFSLVLKFFLALEKNTKGSSLGQYALFSYICTVSGIVFLFLAGVQFVYVLSIAKLLIPIFAILFIVFILFPVPSILNTAKQSKSKSISILGYLTITCFLLAVLSTISIILLIYGIVLPLPIMWGYLLIGSLFLSIPFLFALIILSYVQVHKRK